MHVSKFFNLYSENQKQQMDWAYFGDNNVYYLRNQPELFQGNRA